MNRLAFALLALSAACGIAQPNDTATPQQLSQQQALEAARRDILQGYPHAGLPALRSYEVVKLDPKTWGERYWAFRFSALGRNSIYYVNKQSGFVQPTLDLTKNMVRDPITTGPLPPELERVVHEVDGWNITLRKRTLGEDYLVTIVLNPPTQTTASHSLLFDIREGGDRPHPKYYYPERKEIGRIKDVQNCRKATFVVRKRDLEKYEYVCPIISAKNAGRSWSFKIGEIPDE